MRHEGINAFMRVPEYDYLGWLTVKLMQLDGLTRLVALKYCQPTTGCSAEKLPNEHD